LSTHGMLLSGTREDVRRKGLKTMKTGRTLTELAQELERQVKSKKDFIADTRRLAMAESGNDLQMINGSVKSFSVSDLCHNQIGARLGIPAKYYDKMRQEAPGLLAYNVNAWFTRSPERRLLRTIDGRARAFLSDRYRPLDNFDLAEVILPKLNDIGCKVESAELTESRLYIKAITPRITAEVKKGDVVQAGLVISNSEVGCGSVRIEPLIFRLVCLNGMISADHSLKKYHVGKGSGDMEDAENLQFYRDETRQADDRAFWLKVRDVVDATLTPDKFRLIVEKMQRATDQKITGDPVEAVEVIKTRFALSDDEGAGVLRHLINGGDLSAYGVANALTRQSQDIRDYDRATDFERMGGIVIDLPRQDWQAIATAN